MRTADLSRLSPRDREYVERIEDPGERETIVSTILRYQRPDRLREGDAMPPLELLRLEDGRSQKLSELLAGRPLVLVFGSFTWPPFRRRSGDVESLYRAFRDRASFAFVYIAEAHSVDGWQMQANEDEDVLLHQHVTLEDRFAAASEGAERLRLTLPVLVDGMDDAVSEAFSAWPERIYVVRTDGVIGYRGGPGPWRFDPDEATAALEQTLREC